MPNWNFGNDLGWLRQTQGDAVQSLVCAKSEDELQHLRVRSDPLPLRHRTDEARGRQYLKAFVDAYEELRRNDCALHRSELRAFDLARDRTKPACRIYLGLDAT